MPLDDLLDAYATGFYGYGSNSAPFWSIGIEGAGGASFAEVGRQVKCWHDRGRPEVDDLAEVQACMRLTRWSGPRPPLQTTWAQLIRVVFAAQGQPADVESVRQYQTTRLGRRDGETRLLELLPLPSQSTGRWRYSEWTSLPQFKTREAYVEHVARLRSDYIKQQIALHRPAVVMVYGLARFANDCWTAIAGVPIAPVDGLGRGLKIGTDGRTTYVISPHPAAHSITAGFFTGVGSLLRNRSSSGPNRLGLPPASW